MQYTCLGHTQMVCEVSESSVGPSSWTLLLPFPLPLSSPPWGLFVLTCNSLPFQWSKRTGKEGNGKEQVRRTAWKQPCGKKKRKEITGRQKTWETEGILILDYQKALHQASEEGRLKTNEKSGRENSSGSPCKKLWDQRQGILHPLLEMTNFYCYQVTPGVEANVETPSKWLCGYFWQNTEKFLIWFRARV